MNLYLIKQTKNFDYDTYSGAVVVAENEAQAKRTHPSTTKLVWDGKHWDDPSDKDWEISRYYDNIWCAPCYVRVKLLAENVPLKRSIVINSFWAG